MKRIIVSCGLGLWSGCAFLDQGDLLLRQQLGGDTLAEVDTAADADTGTDADTDTGSDTVAGANQPPVAVISGTPIAYKDKNRTFEGIESVDPDGDTLTYAWDFGDGDSDEGDTVKHRYADLDTFTVRLTVDDGEFADTAILEVEVVEDLKVDGIDPSEGAPGETLRVVIDGKGFFEGATVVIGDQITVSDISVNSREEISALLTISGSADEDKYDVEVTNIDDVDDDKRDAFEVTD